MRKVRISFVLVYLLGLLLNWELAIADVVQPGPIQSAFGKVFDDCVKGTNAAEGENDPRHQHVAYYEGIAQSFVRNLCRSSEDPVKIAMTKGSSDCYIGATIPKRKIDSDKIRVPRGSDGKCPATVPWSQIHELTKREKRQGDAVLKVDPESSFSEDVVRHYFPEVKNPDTEESLLLVYSLMFGHGLRESSANIFEGPDLKAGNVGASAEAGLFQVSYNVRYHLPESARDALLELERSYFEADSQRCGYSTFTAGRTKGFESPREFHEVSGKLRRSMRFAAAMKHCPALASDIEALTLRHAMVHYGPLKRKEVKKIEACMPLLKALKAKHKSGASSCDQFQESDSQRAPASQVIQ